MTTRPARGPLFHLSTTKTPSRRAPAGRQALAQALKQARARKPPASVAPGRAPNPDRNS